ncbi:GspH/FimT family protein [Solimicrobium silvestre]|uniref:Type II secretion system protein H n=1 Tax=Solimicrobium silvestre TaxID=2099400 RepID=A0A2S9GYR7_9BURK|nr:GspH/FimT family protein [Solimicrobium silvestre]PRC92859.1 Type II secretion system protein H [Solimicrobium silvestre]
MLTSAAKPSAAKTSPQAHRKAAGFTLLELLVVLVVVGIMLGMVSMNALPNKKQALLGDAKRVALLLQLAREEAIVRNRPVAFELDSEQFRFYVRGDSGWQLLNDNDLFRERSFKNSPLAITMQPSPNQTALPLKIIFGREPVDKPFTLTFGYEDATATIQADGIGHFSVE